MNQFSQSETGSTNPKGSKIPYAMKCLGKKTLNILCLSYVRNKIATNTKKILKFFLNYLHLN